VDVQPWLNGLDDQTTELVDDIRSRGAPFPIQTTGESSEFVDEKDSLASRLPLAIVILALTTFVVLFLMTGSVVLPIKSVIMNLLTLSFTLGVLVLIFQDGRFESALDFTSLDAVDIAQPILICAVAFGLSTDYAVFLLGRITEARTHGASDREAIAIGIERTGRIVTQAAILFCLAIGAFATSSVIFIKEVGVGTAVAVIIDSTIIRALLVPSLMAMLGGGNWWAPKPLRKLHNRIGLSEG
jgi:RND superfamily putative drug exporter